MRSVVFDTYHDWRSFTDDSGRGSLRERATVIRHLPKDRTWAGSFEEHYVTSYNNLVLFWDPNLVSFTHRGVPYKPTPDCAFVSFTTSFAV